MVLAPIPQPLPVHFFGSRPQPPTSRSSWITRECVMCNESCQWMPNVLQASLNSGCLSGHDLTHMTHCRCTHGALHMTHTTRSTWRMHTCDMVTFSWLGTQAALSVHVTHYIWHYVWRSKTSNIPPDSECHEWHDSIHMTRESISMTRYRYTWCSTRTVDASHMHSHTTY